MKTFICKKIDSIMQEAKRNQENKVLKQGSSTQIDQLDIIGKKILCGSQIDEIMATLFLNVNLFIHLVGIQF